MIKISDINAIIFDLDGLLLDSEPVYRTVWQTACRELGYEMSNEEHLSLLGRGRKGALEHLASCNGPDFPIEQLAALLPVVEEKLFEETELILKPGAVDLVQYLEAQAKKFAIATSTNQAAATKRIGRTALGKHFTNIVGGNNVANGKPAPDIFLHTAQLLEEPPAACLVLEDSESGIQAAHAAGMQVICVPDLKIPRDEIRLLATAVYESLIEVQLILKQGVVR